MSDPALSAVMQRLDEAVLDPGCWPDVLKLVADALGAQNSALLSHSHGFGLWDRVDPEGRSLFYERFLDNPMQRGMDRLRDASGGRPPPVVTDRHLHRRAELERSEFFNEFMSPHSGASMMLVDVSHRDVRGALNISAARDGYEREDIARMGELRPALSRAFWLSLKLGERDRADGDLASFFDRAAGAVLLLAGDGRVRRANPAAEALLREPGGLSISRGRLCAPTPEATVRLRMLIGEAAHADGARGTAGMAVATPGRRLPLSLMVTPLRGEQATDAFGGRSVLVSITDLDAPVSLRGAALRDLFGLTAAEVRVAVALAEGATMQEAAETLGLSFFTVRAHMARIFQKTDTHRQADLVRLVLRALRPLDS